MAVLIRPATLDDVGDMARIELDAGRRFRDIGLDAIAEDLPDPDELRDHVHSATAWVAVEDDAIIGYALSAVVDGEGYLHQVSVQESAAGRRVGRALIEEVFAWARHGGFGAVTLTTFCEVPWNGPYYARIGFVRMAPATIGPELRAVRAAETAAGIDVMERMAMRRTLI